VLVLAQTYRHFAFDSFASLYGFRLRLRHTKRDKGSDREDKNKFSNRPGQAGGARRDRFDPFPSVAYGTIVGLCITCRKAIPRESELPQRAGFTNGSIR
jgi:hypothetical protein